MTLPATLYVQKIERWLVADADMTGALKYRGPMVGQLVGKYTLQRLVTATVGSISEIDVTPDAGTDPLPSTLYVQGSASGNLLLNRTVELATRQRGGDGQIGIYQRQKYVRFAPSVTLTDVVATTPVTPASQG